MNQLQIVHKKSTSKNQTTELVEAVENKREDHGRNIALTRRVYRIVNSDTFYCQSESTDIYYFVRFNPSVLEWCSCPDNSYRGNTCKHIFGVIEGIKRQKIIDVEKLPPNIKRDNIVPKSYRDDLYDF
jgi:hypothetical protein